MPTTRFYYPFFVLTLAVGLGLMGACNIEDPHLEKVENSDEERDTGTDADAQEQSNQSTDADSGDTGPTCSENETYCETADQCVDLDHSIDHCGECDSFCGSEFLPESAPVGATPTCEDGECVYSCPEGSTECDDTCVELESDSEHCGMCGRSCASSDCSQGTCEPLPCDPNSSPFGGGEGTDEAPYTICTVEHLTAVDSHPAAHFVLSDDIVFPESESFPTITELQGSFDGFGFSIVNLSFDLGLFGTGLGFIETIRPSATVTDLRLEEVEIPYDELMGGSNEPRGGLAMVNQGEIARVHVTGLIGGDQQVGGLVGTNEGTIIDSSADVEIEAITRNAGGLVGFLAESGTIVNSTASGDVTGDAREVGGLVGEAAPGSSIIGSSASGSVAGQETVGGLVGLIHGEGVITDSRASGDVYGTQQVGGLVGHTELVEISESVATGKVEAEGDDVGGLIGRVRDSTVSRCFAGGDVMTQGRSAGGLIGRFDGNTGNLVKNSHAIGHVSADDHVGGLVGRFDEGTLVNSYAAGEVEGSSQVGGLVGQFGDVEVVSSYWDVDTSGIPNDGDPLSGDGLPTEDFDGEGPFFGWDFEEIWIIAEDGNGVIRPHLRGISN